MLGNQHTIVTKNQAHNPVHPTKTPINVFAAFADLAPR